MAIYGIHHFALSVPDMDKALGFYRDVLGFEVVDRGDIEPSPETSAVTELKNPRATGILLKGGWGYVELFEFQNPKPKDNQFFWTLCNEPGVRHFSLFVEDANNAYDYLKDYMLFHREPIEHSVEGEDNVAWTTYGRDPFGNIIEIWQLGGADPQAKAPSKAPMPELSAKTTGAKPKAGILGLHHVALVVDDLPKAMEFYQTHFGFMPVQEGPIEPTEYAEEITQLPKPEADGFEMETDWMYLELWEFKHPVNKGRGTEIECNEYGPTHFSVMVDDCQKEYDRLKKVMRFHSEPIQVGEKSYATYGRDPFGNIIELWQLGPNDPQPFAPRLSPTAS